MIPLLLLAVAQDEDPVVFIHGLASSSRTWSAALEHGRAQGCSAGGVFDLRKRDVAENLRRAWERGTDPAGTGVRKGRCFALDFSDPENLTFRDQGDQIAWVVHAVRRITGRDRVILVGHSMGGLAARAYLQYHRKGDVAALVTIGTPHAGSILAYVGTYLRDHPDEKKSKLFAAAVDVLGPDLATSAAVRNLEPGSEALRDLNAQPLPREVRYISVIGDSKTEILSAIAEKFFKVYSEYYEKRAGSAFSSGVMRRFSDGVVPVVSQYLFSVYPEKGFDHEEVFVSSGHLEQTKEVEAIWKAVALAGRAPEFTEWDAWSGFGAGSWVEFDDEDSGERSRVKITLSRKDSDRLVLADSEGDEFTITREAKWWRCEGCQGLHIPKLTAAGRERVKVGAREVDCFVYDDVSPDCTGKQERGKVWLSREVPGWLVRSVFPGDTRTCIGFEKK